ncbi:cell division protein ZapA [Anaeromicropila herbilytica]|uniref:Cell division protein ZapA n=1 Tax=Anaeromicropila herbilytica TaxID=2785025 RepID=A0A7R7ID38_9FIRM|nr:cell division protein ZapA [Anaeromicropila herbilytica]BCN30501.1 hypothetical protein bsdtb5_17960 [Anaeromicropila herbilytica]
MNTMNNVEVIINNKRYTLSGYESGEYLQRVASYINGKHQEFRQKDSYNRLDVELKNILLEINIADDYFKAKKEIKDLEEDSDMKSNEIFNIKHEMIAAETKLSAALKELEALKTEYNDAQKKIVKLETELEDYNKHQQE